jgi:DNA primase
MATNNKKATLRKILGQPRELSNGQLLFKCPFCKHHKKKLQVHLDLGQWHCWVCSAKGRSFTSLLKKLQITDRAVYLVFRSNKNNVLLAQNKEILVDTNKELLSLPKEFKPLYHKQPDLYYKHALGYLFKRGLSVQDILKYRIGYCDSGPYMGMVIIPSYDENGMLNFFTGRSFLPDAKMNHKNPKISKDIIGFDLFINWNLPITIVEGAFDAIAVKRNAIPLFGKKLLSKLKEKIILKKVKILYICLDVDASKDAITMTQLFINNGIDVRMINLDKKDPNDVGFVKMTELLSNSVKTTGFEDIIKLKLFS